MIDRFKRRKNTGDCELHGKPISCICTELTCERNRLCCKECLLLHAHSSRIQSIEAFQNRKLELVASRNKSPSRNLLIDIDLMAEKMVERMNRLRNSLFSRVNEVLGLSDKIQASSCTAILRKNIFEMQKGEVGHLVLLLSNDEQTLPRDLLKAWESIEPQLLESINLIPEKFEALVGSNPFLDSEQARISEAQRRKLRKVTLPDIKVEPARATPLLSSKYQFRDQLSSQLLGKDYRPTASTAPLSKDLSSEFNSFTSGVHPPRSSGLNSSLPLSSLQKKESRPLPARKERPGADFSRERERPSVQRMSESKEIIEPRIEGAAERSARHSVPQPEPEPTSHSHVELKNTLIFFSCCSKYYECPQCHDEREQHEYQDESPSIRYCKNCRESFMVECGVGVAIRCFECEQ